MRGKPQSGERSAKVRSSVGRARFFCGVEKEGSAELGVSFALSLSLSLSLSRKLGKKETFLDLGDLGDARERECVCSVSFR